MHSHRYIFSELINSSNTYEFQFVLSKYEVRIHIFAFTASCFKQASVLHITDLCECLMINEGVTLQSSQMFLRIPWFCFRFISPFDFGELCFACFVRREQTNAFQ